MTFNNVGFPRTLTPFIDMREEAIRTLRLIDTTRQAMQGSKRTKSSNSIRKHMASIAAEAYIDLRRSNIALGNKASFRPKKKKSVIAST
ncbi:MAG: hypothetical protein KTR14_00465 [Vampirovibrio sp.]|nr:hypothetical protein [Vampirovibrio sp.]